MDEVIIVCSGSNREFERYCKENNLTADQAVYAFNSEKIINLKAKQVVIYGTFWKRNYAAEIYKIALTRLVGD